MRILYGLETLPRDLQNPRLPAVTVGPAMLRLNSAPLPADLVPAEPGHTARIAALRDWLLGQCGDYAADRRRFVSSYLDWAAGAIAAHRAELEEKLARFDGLFAAEDFFWSAPRPLPRAWLPQAGGWERADLVFWDGRQALRIDPALPPDVQLPDGLLRFWNGETLPTSPFRRAVEWPPA